jgi:hypothetical protein
MMRWWSLPVFIGLIIPAAGAIFAAEPALDFGRDILSILSENCFQCHGLDAAHRQADLRLDSLTGGATKAIKPGNGQESELVHRIQCRDTNQPAAALIKDLKQRGLLADTLVVWGGELGRTPFIQGNIEDRTKWGRDHHPFAFTIWMSGDGVKPGISYGQSKEFGHNAIETRVNVHDQQATILNQVGIDHERLTDKFQGHNSRLTDVHGQVVKDILS